MSERVSISWPKRDAVPGDITIHTDNSIISVHRLMLMAYPYFAGLLESITSTTVHLPFDGKIVEKLINLIYGGFWMGHKKARELLKILAYTGIYYDEWFNRLFIDSINLQDAEKAKSLIPKVSWKNMKQLGWIAVVPSSLIPHLQDGIKYIKKYFENIILRDVTANRKQGRDKTGRNLMYWLILARDLYDKVTISIVNNKTTISIGDTIVRFDHDVTAKGKYKGLDMFSDKGIPLTTRQEIKERRAELQRA